MLFVYVGFNFQVNMYLSLKGIFVAAGRCEKNTITNNYRSYIHMLVSNNTKMK